MLASARAVTHCGQSHRAIGADGILDSEQMSVRTNLNAQRPVARLADLHTERFDARWRPSTCKQHVATDTRTFRVALAPFASLPARCPLRARFLSLPTIPELAALSACLPGNCEHKPATRSPYLRHATPRQVTSRCSPPTPRPAPPRHVTPRHATPRPNTLGLHRRTALRGPIRADSSSGAERTHMRCAFSSATSSASPSSSPLSPERRTNA